MLVLKVSGALSAFSRIHQRRDKRDWLGIIHGEYRYRSGIGIHLTTRRQLREPAPPISPVSAAGTKALATVHTADSRPERPAGLRSAAPGAIRARTVLADLRSRRGRRDVSRTSPVSAAVPRRNRLALKRPEVLDDHVRTSVTVGTTRVPVAAGRDEIESAPQAPRRRLGVWQPPRPS